MKAITTDREALASISPTDAVKYLRNHGWQRVESLGDRGEYWLHTLPSGEEAELLLPMKRSLADFSYRMAEVLQTLESVEGRSQVEIVQDISAAGVVAVALSHDQKIGLLIERYEAQGYEVLLNPRRCELPDFLRGFHPDFLATKNGESVLVEVRSRNKVRRVDYWRELASAVEKHPEWKLELVLPPITEPEPESLSEAEIRDLLTRSEKVAAEGAAEAGFLLVWSAVEATLRLLMERYNVETSNIQPRTLIGRLYGDGLMEREDYASLVNYLLYRNSLVHGFRQSVTADDIAQLRLIVERLLNE